MQIIMDEHSAWTAVHADALARQLEAERPDGLLVVLFANHSRAMADRLTAAEKLGTPVVFYIGPAAILFQSRRCRAKQSRVRRHISSDSTWPAPGSM